MKSLFLLFFAVSAFTYGVSFSNGIRPRDIHVNDINTPTVTSNLNPVLNSSPTAPWLPKTPPPLVSSFDITKPRLEAFIRVPSEIVKKPYVILSGYQSFQSDSGPIAISGTVIGKSFYCPSSPCAVEFPESAQITFQANNKNGDTSSEVQANILVRDLLDGYSLEIITIGKFVVFSDSCANIWQNAEPSPPGWARFPQNPDDLNTDKKLFYLATRLLTTGVVNAKDCPGGGFDNYSPNACGLAKAQEQMSIWQNQYNLNIWMVGRDEHIPPVLLKTLLEIESQFWPTSQRLFLDEIGLGQINQLGIDVLLRTNPGLYNQVCTSSLYRCDKPYQDLAGIDRALIRGTLVQSLDAACPTCLYGVDLNKASQSIPLIAKVLYANCVQTKSILKLHEVTASYQDSWKFTLVSYHSGFGCLQNAIEKSAKNGTRLTWESAINNMACPGAVSYVDKFWSSLNSFFSYPLKQSTLEIVQLQSTVVDPTPTPFIPITRVLVKIFVDKNSDGVQQSNETLDDVQVNLDLENGVSMTQKSKNGTAIFEIPSIERIVKGFISLPGLYRSAPISISNTGGEVAVTFIFTKPILPTQLP